MFGAKGLLSNQVKLEVPVPEFIPYACHYDDTTILSKNGELIQIIKITGFSFEKVGAEKVDLRETVRKAILENVKEDNFALWFHTIRRKKNLDPGGAYPTGFSSFMHESWCKKNDWEHQYVNELYITIIHEGQLQTIPHQIRQFFKKGKYTASRKSMNSYLKASSGRLNQVTNGMLEVLKDYGASKLSVVDRNGEKCSEMLEFFGKIMHLAEDKKPMPVMDLSYYLATHKIAFGTNELEVIGKTGKHFGAILTVKEYQEVSATAMDHFLQLPMQFIISQTIIFKNSKAALKNFQYQNYILKVSGDKHFAKISGLTDIMESNRGLPTDYGEQQLSIMLLEDDLELLKDDVKYAADTLADMGIITVREDLRMEQCFWSQLPANFTHICRKKPINTSRIAGFASLYNFPAGQPAGNKWGNAVTVFRTIEGTPYFFNFHVGDCGHTIIIGPHGSGKTILLNFLISEARKFRSRIYFFDQGRAAKVFITSMGGTYNILSPTSETQMRFNPLLLEDSAENRTFLQRWLTSLTGSEVDLHLIDKIYQMPQEQRRLSQLATLDATFAPLLANWIGEGKYANLFDNQEDQFSDEILVQAFGTSQIAEDVTLIEPVLSYIFHRIEMTLDGEEPGIIVLEEAWKLVNNPTFAPLIGDWLDRMEAKNTIVVFATESIENASKSEITSAISERIATKIFLPNSNALNSSRAYREVWGLSEKEFELLLEMQLFNREFLLVQGEDAVVAELSLEGLEAEMAVLSGGDESVSLMEEAIAEAGNELVDWLPVFQKKVLNVE